MGNMECDGFLPGAADIKRYMVMYRCTSARMCTCCPLLLVYSMYTFVSYDVQCVGRRVKDIPGILKFTKITQICFNSAEKRCSE
jgi:hypothetical protein